VPATPSNDHAQGRSDKRSIEMVELSAHRLGYYADLFSNVALVAKLGYQHEDKWYTSINVNSGNYDTATGNVREFDTDTYFVDVQSTLPLGGDHTLTGGIYFRDNIFDQRQYNIANYRHERSKIGGKTELTQGTDRYYAIYLQDEIALSDSITAFYRRPLRQLGGVRRLERRRLCTA
jgi:outer membrane receptor for ferrienterochelin and colicin